MSQSIGESRIVSKTRLRNLSAKLEETAIQRRPLRRNGECVQQQLARHDTPEPHTNEAGKSKLPV